MPAPLDKQPRKARFGSFEADFTSGELRRQGNKLRFAGHPFELLAMLLLRPGEVVTREEIRERLWSKETNVEFDHGINLAMNRIRSVLSIEQDRDDFQIETLRGRGYRLNGAVELEWVEPSPVAQDSRPDILQDKPQDTPENIPQNASQNIPQTIPPALAANGRKFLPLAALALVIIAAIAGGLFFLVRSRKPVGSPPALTVVPLAGDPGVQDKAAFSPDGRMVAFLWTKEGSRYLDVYVKLVGSEAALQLTSDAANKASPSWSPDGREVAFIRESKKGNGIYIVPALGGAERRVGTVTVEGDTMSWSPDGKYLAFVNTDPATGVNSIFIYGMDTGQTHVLAQSHSHGDSQPAFSPDGRNVAFVRSGTAYSDCDLWIAPSAGGEARQITNDHREIIGAAWTHDGRSLIYSSGRQGLPRLWRVQADGSGPTEAIVAAGYNVRNPAVTAGAMAFTEAYTNINVWRFDAKTAESPSGVTKIIASNRNQHSPQISPDGSEIVFASDRTGAEEIWVSDRNGGSLRQLTSFNGPRAGSPRWSPDGRWIAFDARPNRNADVYIMPRAGGAPRRLTTGPARDYLPSWSHDGKWIYFDSDRSGVDEIYRTPVDGGRENGQDDVRMTHHGGFESMESPDGKYLYYSKGRQDGIWRVALNVLGAVEERVEELKDVGHYRAWTVTRQGYYYMRQEDGPFPTISFFDFANRRKTRLATLQKPGDSNGSALSVSSDGRTILFTQVDQQVRDIMLIPNFQ